MITMSMYNEIQKCKRQGLGIREICPAVGASRNTVRKYYRMSENDFVHYLHSCKQRGKKFEPYCDEIITLYRENEGKKVYTRSIFDVLEERHVILPGSERTLRNYFTYLTESGALDTGEAVRVYQKIPEAEPGSQMQVDFGVEKDSFERPIYIFAALLSHSRYRYVSVQERPFTTVDVIVHLLDCFIAFGGKPEQMVIDQDVVLVVSENGRDIIYTRAFKQFIDEQELSMRVCKKADPQSKGKVENLVGFVKSSFFSSRTFDSFEQIPAALSQWLRRRANGRVTQATGKIPDLMLEEERKSLQMVRRSVFEKERRSEREGRKADEKGSSEALYRELEKQWNFRRWAEFLASHKKRFQRYLREQYAQLHELLEKGPEKEAMEQAVAFCLEVDQLSAKSLQDAYEYYLHVDEQYYPDILSSLAQRDVTKHRNGVRVQKRNVGYYSSIVSIVGGLL